MKTYDIETIRGGAVVYADERLVFAGDSLTKAAAFIAGDAADTARRVGNAYALTEIKHARQITNGHEYWENGSPMKISMIKELRARTGLVLLEAKNIIEFFLD